MKLHRVQHYGSKCYKCTICDETFKSKKEMEAHIKGHASEITDEDGNDSTLSTELDTRKNQNSSNPMTTISKPSSAYIETPRESSSEANSDADEIAYYNMHFSRLEQANINNYNMEQTSGVDPALLAAVSLAASVVGNGEMGDYRSVSPNRTQSKNTTGMHTPPLVHHQNNFSQNNLVYEPLAVMRQQGYFTPAPRVEEFR